MFFSYKVIQFFAHILFCIVCECIIKGKQGLGAKSLKYNMLYIIDTAYMAIKRYVSYTLKCRMTSNRKMSNSVI